MESFTPSPDQLERAFMKDIPNIMQYLECDTNTHWTAEGTYNIYNKKMLYECQ